MRLGKQNTSTESTNGTDSLFSLKRIGALPNGPCVLVDFSPPTPTPTPTQPQPQFLTGHPRVNLDRHYYTPAFILEEDEAKIRKNMNSYLALHSERANEASIEKEEMFVARPSRENSFCSICKMAFDDYLTHLSTPHHQQLLRSSPFCNDILALTTRFVQKSKAIAKGKKRQARPSRARRAEKEDLSEANTTVSSVLSIDEYPLDKAIPVC